MTLHDGIELIVLLFGLLAVLRYNASDKQSQMWFWIGIGCFVAGAALVPLLLSYLSIPNTPIL